jgi:glycosyltransferase involved in cell wall biosynthesis
MEKTMKKIMVFDVPAESGGALSVLMDFYHKHKLDTNKEYIYVLSKPELIETRNIKVIRFPWIKKSWIHRLYFDKFIAPKLIKQYAVDEILSLQNVIVHNRNTFQTLYVHNSIPFSKYRFSLLENKLLWVYQNIIGRSIFRSIKKANRIIVQTEWMKKACLECLKINPNKIEVMKPNINIEVENYFKATRDNLSTFFFPASGVEFKNHKVIVEACLELKKNGVNNFKVVFTLNKDETKKIAALSEIVKRFDLPVHFIGNITREKVFEYYSKSVLIFPSYIETVGLPLIEAKLHGAPVLVSDCEFSHEILREYNDIKYFDPFNKQDLAKVMLEMLEHTSDC